MRANSLDPGLRWGRTAETIKTRRSYDRRVSFAVSLDSFTWRIAVFLSDIESSLERRWGTL